MAYILQLLNPMESADKAQSKANLSLVAAIGALAYGYFTGVFSDDN